jgi:2-C-methyl-D-erythritol 4-phosphate cytidylyltransferase
VPQIERIVVALPEGLDAPAGTIGVPGGAERSHSVRNALAAAVADGLGADDAVLVQDAARPLLTAELAQRCLAALDDADAAVAAAPVTDTTKEAGEDGLVTRTLDRSRLWAVQTPQVFRRPVLERVLAWPEEVLAAATDDASLVEAAGGRVRVVEATRENLKVTTPVDLRVAELLLAERAPA